jgi:hypothetical protein
MASLPYGYPPAAIPACVLLSRFPWVVALVLWKLLNLAILVGCVLLTFRIFLNLRLAGDAQYLAWSLVVAFSPTVSVLLVGQSSLFVLYAGLLSLVLAEQRRPGAAGASLAFSLIKPHLVLPLVGFLLVNRHYRVVLVAGIATAVLTLAGLYLGHDSLEGYLYALRRYAAWNSPDNPRLVGLPNLITGVLGLPASVGSLVAVCVGLALLAWILAQARTRPQKDANELLPAMLVVSVLSFGAHSYDLVFLIPVCVWAIGRVQRDRRFLPIVLLCALLVLPLGAVARAYDLLLSDVLGDRIFRVAIEPFRSWTLLLLCSLVMHVVARPPAQPGGEVVSSARWPVV